MKCSNFKRLYMETDRCIYLPHTHICLYLCCMHTHTRYSGRRAVQLPVQIHGAWPAAVGEVLGHRGCSGSGTGEWLRSCVLSGCTANGGGAVLQVLCALRILCGNIPGCAEDTELGRESILVGDVTSCCEKAFLALRTLSQNKLGWQRPWMSVIYHLPKKHCGLEGGCDPHVHP